MIGLFVGTGTILSLLYGLLLYFIGKSRKDHTKLFYVVAGVPILFGLLSSLAYASQLIGQIGIGWIFVIFLMLVSERAVWVITLRKVSGEKRIAWFFIILFIPLLGWLLYWVTETW